MKIKYILLPLVIALIGCSGGGSVKHADEIKIEIDELYSWVNLMPGSEPSFHFSGKGTLINNSRGELKKIEIVEASVLQNNEILYKIKPSFEYSSQSIQSGDSVTFKFESGKGVQFKNDLNPDSLINIIIKLKADKFFINKKLDKVKIEKAY